jgi:hypothetical protein
MPRWPRRSAAPLYTAQPPQAARLHHGLRESRALRRTAAITHLVTPVPLDLPAEPLPAAIARPRRLALHHSCRTEQDTDN